MTRILVQRGNTNSSSTGGRTIQHPASQLASTSREEEQEEETCKESTVLDDPLLDQCGSSEDILSKADESFAESCLGSRYDTRMDDHPEKGKSCHIEFAESGVMIREQGALHVLDRPDLDTEASRIGSLQIVTGSCNPPPPPVPPPKPSAMDPSSRRNGSGISDAVRIDYSRRPSAWPVIFPWTNSAGSHPSSPRSYGVAEGYNSAYEQIPSYGSSYDDAERECLFELDMRRAKGFEVRWMLEDGNCLFCAVADQVYGGAELYDLARQVCIDYMERERDHFSQFITEGFTSYCKRKRRDKVYGNNMEIQAFSEMYNCPIHIYSYSTEPINIFHGSYTTDTPPIQLSYHYGNHYNSLVDPRHLTVGAGLGFSSLHGTNIDKDQVKAAIKAQQEQRIDNTWNSPKKKWSEW